MRDNSKLLFVKIQETIESVIGKISSFRAIEANNHVFILNTKSNRFLCKIYDPKGFIPDLELNVYKILPPNPYTRETVFINDKKDIIDYDFAVFEYIEGVTLEDLILQREGKIDDKIPMQIYDYINLYLKIPSKGFGILDNKLIGKNKDWISYQIEMIVNSLYFLVNSGFPEIFTKDILKLLIKHEDLLSIKSTTLIPIDLNLRNFLISENNDLKVIDIGSVLSGDIYNSYGEFLAHSFDTYLGRVFLSYFSEKEEILKIRLYALLDCINILSFIAKHNGNLFEVKPWGNTNTFLKLVNAHIDYLKNEC